MIGPFETVRLRKDGQPMEVSLTVSPVRSRDGRVVGASEIVRDITEQKRVRRERERLLEAAETANRAKDEFLAMVGHELRNPIAALSAAGEVLARAGKRADLAHNALAILHFSAKPIRRNDDAGELADRFGRGVTPVSLSARVPGRDSSFERDGDNGIVR
jgi:signal transduction histidine kinase